MSLLKGPAGGERRTVRGLGHLAQFEGDSGRREQMIERVTMAKDTLFKVSAQSSLSIPLTRGQGVHSPYSTPPPWRQGAH